MDLGRGKRDSASGSPSTEQIRDGAIAGLFDLVLVVDAAGRCLEALPDVPPAAIFIAPPVGCQLDESLQPALARAFLEGLGEVHRSKGPSTFRCPLTKPERVLVVRASPSVHDGKVEGVTFFANTEELQDPLRPTPASSPSVSGALESVIKQLDQGVLLQGPKAEILMSNQAALDMLGLTEAQLLGRSSFDPSWRVVREDDSDFPGPEHPVPTAIASKKPVRNVTMGVYRPRTADQVWLQVSAVPELDAAGEVLRVVCSFTDVTARRTALQDVRREHQLMRQVMNTSVSGIVVLDPEGQLTFTNPAADKVLGLAEGEVAASPCNARRWNVTSLDGEPWPKEAHAFSRVMASKQPVYNVRYWIERADGTRRAVAVDGAPVLDDAGEIERLVLALTDITEQLRADEEQTKLRARMEELARQESLAGLAGGLAHDYNNLLVGILTASEFAADLLGVDHPAAEHLEIVQEAGTRAAELTQQLLAYSGGGQFLVQRLDISELAQQMKQLSKVLDGSRLRMELDEGLPPIEADPGRIKQLLFNLVANAAESLDGDGQVTLRTGQVDATSETLREANTAGQDLAPGRFVFAEVEDEGSGMSANTVQRMFDPFFTTKAARQGLGLAAGLAVLRGHGGYLEVSSRLGHGSRVRVAFPATTLVEIAPATVDCSAPGWAPQGPILVVDDEPLVRRMAGRILGRYGVEVLTARDGLEGIEIFMAEQHRLEAVLLDLTMPKLNGEQVLREIRASNRDIPVVVMSGYTEHEISDPSVRTTFVAKPFNIQGLIDALHRVITVE